VEGVPSSVTVLVPAPELHSGATPRQAKRINFESSGVSVLDGPFAETKELVAGFWMWQVRDMDEAVSWAKRIPNPDHVHGEVELRPVFEAEDFGAEYTPEL